MTLIRIENNCNQKCVFCSFDPSKERRSAKLGEILKEIENSKEKLVQISGGEPFLAGCLRVLKIAAFAAKAGKKIEIQTNAALIADCAGVSLKKIIRILNLSGGYFNVNLSASNEDLDKKTVGAVNFAEKIKALKLLIKLKAKVRITHIIYARNYKNLPEFAKFISSERRGIKWIQFSFVKAEGKALTKKIVPGYCAVSPFLIKACRVLEKNGINFEIDHIPPCMLGEFYARHVDIKKAALKLSGPHNKEKTYIKKCLKCEYANICYGPRKDYLKIHKSF